MVRKFLLYKQHWLYITQFQLLSISDQKHPLLHFAGELHKFACLLNSRTFAPKLFRKIMKLVFAALQKEGHNITGYLDESILFWNSYIECKINLLRAMHLFPSLGFQV